VQSVEWLSSEDADQSESLKSLDAAVSCVGNLRPSTEWDGFWGLHYDQDILQRTNGDVNDQIIKAAKRLGAQRFAYVSASAETQRAFAGALKGYVKGKRQAEETARELFGNDATIIGPGLVYGGGRFETAGKIFDAVTSSPPTKAFIEVNGRLQTISGSVDYPYQWPNDLVNKVFLTPPVDVDTAARAIAAGVLGATPLSFINGTDEIQKVADETSQEELEAAAARLAQTLRLPTLPIFGRIGLTTDGAERGDEAPFEGALVGARPFLYPVPVAAFFYSICAWAVTNPFGVK
jgi:hypothetical protein